MPACATKITPATARTYLFSATLLFQIITVGLSAGVVDCNGGYWYCYGREAAAAILTWSAMQTLWLALVLTVSHFYPSSILVSAMADAVALSFFLVFGVGAVSAGTLNSGLPLIIAEVVFGWMVNALNLASLLLVTVYTLSKCCSYELWRQSLADLEGGRIRLSDEEHGSGSSTPKSDVVEPVAAAVAEQGTPVAAPATPASPVAPAAPVSPAPVVPPAPSLPPAADSSTAAKCPHCNH